jgi:hypothetical protein
VLNGVEKEERVPGVARKTNTQKNANREPRRKTKPRKRVEASLASLVVPRAERRQLELILRNQQKSAAEADQGFGGV